MSSFVFQSLHLTLKPGRKSIRDNKSVEKLKELQGSVDHYAKEAKAWSEKEENFQAIICVSCF